MVDSTLSKGDIDYASFAAAGADVNIVATIDGAFRYVAPRCRRVSGWEPAALEGRSEDEFVHPDDLGAVHANRARLATGGVGTASYRFRCSDDTFRWGVEALVRIYDPDEGLLPPALFLEAAEQNGLLTEIDELVLCAAVANIAAWNGHHGSNAPPNVAINVTARHLADVSFPQSITDRCISACISPADLSIEVTERVLIEASRSALTVLRALRLAGMRVGLDDFGTGYSSLSYLRQFPLDFLKIDRSLIADLERGESERAIVVAIIGLAHALELDVVAEGVETGTQLRALQDLGCDYAQGFLFSPSLASKSVNATVAAGPDPALRGGEAISHPVCVAVRS